MRNINVKINDESYKKLCSYRDEKKLGNLDNALDEFIQNSTIVEE